MKSQKHNKKDGHIFRQEFLTEVNHIEDTVIKVIVKYRKRPTVPLLYPQNIRIIPSVLSTYPLDEITKQIKRLDMKKACQDMDIASNVIKESSDTINN